MRRVQIVCAHLLSCTTLQYFGMRCSDRARTIFANAGHDSYSSRCLPTRTYWTASIHSGDELGIHPIGLATQSHGLGIVAGILWIEQEDQKAKLDGEPSEQLVIGTGGFHADTATRRRPLEKGKQCRPLIGDLAHRETSFRTGHHDLVLGDIGTDIAHYRWGLHDVFPMIKLRGAGVEHTGVSLRSNRRS